MKKALLMALVALFVAGSAYATDWIGLYTDPGHTQYTMGPSFTLYVFVNMLDHNMKAVEFRLVFPPHAARNGPVVLGPDMINQFCCPFIEEYWAGEFNNCHMGWWEICHMDVTVTPGDYGEVIQIAPGDVADPHIIQIADCDGNIWEPVVTHGVIATENASWGAIKNLF